MNLYKIGSNFKEKIEKINWKVVGYWALRILPGVPTYTLIKEYLKPKEKRDSIKIGVGYFGTATLLFTKFLPAVGIISLASLDPFHMFHKEEQQKQEINSDSIAQDSNKLEKTIYLNDIVK